MEAYIVLSKPQERESNFCEEAYLCCQPRMPVQEKCRRRGITRQIGEPQKMEAWWNLLSPKPGFDRLNCKLNAATVVWACEIDRCFLNHCNRPYTLVNSIAMNTSYALKYDVPLSRETSAMKIRVSRAAEALGSTLRPGSLDFQLGLRSCSGFDKVLYRM